MSRFWGLVLCCGLSLPAWAGGDDDSISRSKGRKGGVVVLWPRVVPETDDVQLRQLASRLQTKLSQMAEQTVDPARVDVRPMPERACPMSGCKATSLSVVLGHDRGGCFAVALIGAVDGGTVRLFPMAGTVRLSSREVSFRDPPEEKLLVTEFVPCDQLLMSVDDAQLSAALADAVAR